MHVQRGVQFQNHADIMREDCAQIKHAPPPCGKSILQREGKTGIFPQTGRDAVLFAAVATRQNAGKRIVKANSVPMPQKNAVLPDGFLETADGMQEQQKSGRKKSRPEAAVFPEQGGEADGARTRDLQRDRLAL